MRKRKDEETKEKEKAEGEKQGNLDEKLVTNSKVELAMWRCAARAEFFPKEL
jgi:hypothetical protein